LHTAAFRAGSEKRAVGVTQGNPRLLGFFQQFQLLAGGAFQRLLPGLIQLFIGRLILRGGALIHFGLRVGVATVIRPRRAAGQ